MRPRQKESEDEILVLPAPPAMDPVQQPPALSPLRLHANGAAAAEAGEEPLVIQPSEVDVSIDFASVGGLARHLEALRETVLLSLLQPQLVARLGPRPPRGLLLHGPPGTGKTLLVRALAGQAAAALGRPLAFFARKGADLLSKWAGEAERQLRVLFEMAQASAPSIIFFDEIDGLAPVRGGGVAGRFRVLDDPFTGNPSLHPPPPLKSHPHRLGALVTSRCTTAS